MKRGKYLQNVHCIQITVTVIVINGIFESKCLTNANINANTTYKYTLQTEHRAHEANSRDMEMFVKFRWFLTALDESDGGTIFVIQLI